MSATRWTISRSGGKWTTLSLRWSSRCHLGSSISSVTRPNISRASFERNSSPPFSVRTPTRRNAAATSAAGASSATFTISSAMARRGSGARRLHWP